MPRLRLRTFLRRLTRKLLPKSLRSRTPIAPETLPARSNFCRLPAELHFTICSLLSSRDVRNLSLTSSAVRLTILPILFRAIHTDNQETLDAVLSCPNITRHLQEFTVRCFSKNRGRRAWVASSGQDHDRIERIMSEKMVSAIHTGSLRLHFLRRLEWNAIASPADIFWRVISTSCPYLKEISVQVDEPPEGQSSLWKLKRLTSFSLTICDPKAAAKGLSPAMWEMLVTHCPGLRSFTVKGAKGSSLDCSPAFQGRWQNLEQLAISSSAFSDELVQFLRFHTTLQRLDIAWIGTDDQRTSTEATEQEALNHPIRLPLLKTFIGNIHFASKIIASPESIKSLDVSYTLLLPRLVPSLRPFLSSFSLLSSLTISLQFSGTHDSVSIFSVLAASCTHLTFLHVICIPVLPIHRLEELSVELQRLPFLRILQLSEQKFGRYEEFMSDTAGRVALRNPHLTEIRIVWVTTPLSKEHYTQFGTYQVVLNERGEPARLIANEVQTSRRGSKRRWRQFRYNITARRALWETSSSSGSSIAYGLPGFLV